MALSSMTRNALVAAMANPGAATEIKSILEGAVVDNFSIAAGKSFTLGTLAAVGSTTELSKSITGLGDNTAVTIATVTVPNATLGAGIRVTATGTLGDGDSTQTVIANIAVSRIAGAAAKAVAGSSAGAGATAGATANATTTVSVTSMTGAVGAVNTFDIQVKVARSAGASTGHVVAAQIALINGLAGGVTIA